MKLFVGVLLSVIVAIQGAAIDGLNEPIERHLIVPDSLFISAWDYQGRLTTLQQDINEQLTAIRTAVSAVLKTSSNETLGQIDNNAIQLLAQDEPARTQIFAMTPPTACGNNLKILINAITEFTGFGSSNCVATYDRNVQGVLKTAYAQLQKYEASFGDAQQIVVRSFIGINVFTAPEQIEARFSVAYTQRVNEWNAIRPDVENFLRTLGTNIAVFNTVLGECFKGIQDTVNPRYAELQAAIPTCETFNTTPDPFAIFRP